MFVFWLLAVGVATAITVNSCLRNEPDVSARAEDTCLKPRLFKTLCACHNQLGSESCFHTASWLCWNSSCSLKRSQKTQSEPCVISPRVFFGNKNHLFPGIAEEVFFYIMDSLFRFAVKAPVISIPLVLLFNVMSVRSLASARDRRKSVLDGSN